jgi:hypothetical protein
MGFRKLDIDGQTWEWMFLGSWNPKTFGDLIRVKSPAGVNTRVTYAQFFGQDLHSDYRGNTGITPGVVASYIRKVLAGGGTWDPEKDIGQVQAGNEGGVVLVTPARKKEIEDELEAGWFTSMSPFITFMREGGAMTVPEIKTGWAARKTTLPLYDDPVDALVAMWTRGYLVSDTGDIHTGSRYSVKSLNA